LGFDLLFRSLSGVRTATYDGKSVVYADGAEMHAAIASPEAEIARAAARRRRRSA
jgi:hypothetical protein